MRLDNHRLPFILALFAGAAMLGVTAWQGYSFWQSESRKPVMAARAVTEPTPAHQAPQIDLAALPLFGTATPEAAQPVQTENLPETNLRLYLRGVLAADGEFPGSALIEDDDGKTAAYVVGEELPGNATLRTVYPNRVVIERGGTLENLLFPESEDRSGMSFATTDESQDQTNTSATSPPPPSSGAPASASSEQQRREEIRKRLEQLRERLRTNNN